MLDAESCVVIVGAGQAGFQTAASLREQGYAGRVVLIGDEASLPYQRPPLSKAHLKLDAEDAQLHFRPDAFFAEKRIELRAPDRGDRDRPRRAARRARVGRKRGLRPPRARDRHPAAPPAWPGIDLQGVYLLRTVEDARQIRARLQTANRVVIVGAGFIGLEVAATAGAAGLPVTVIEFAERPLKRALSAEMATHLLRAHESRGVAFMLRTSVASIDGRDGHVAASRRPTAAMSKPTSC
jgi:3-phenylpropionate/trans-cinnamate dioxygenase ferredoxin reductase subunit